MIAIGTNKLLGAVPTRWESDLPAITPDGRVALLGAKDVILVDPQKLEKKSTVAGGAKDYWYFFAWDGFRPRAQGLDQPVTFPSDSLPTDSLAASSTPQNAGAVNLPPTAAETTRVAPVPGTSSPAAAPTGFVVSFAALLSEEKAQQVASAIKVNGAPAHVAFTNTAGSPIYRVVMGPFATRQEADRVGKASKREYWIYEGSP